MSEDQCPAPVYANSVVVSVSGYDAFVRFVQNVQNAEAADESPAVDKHSVACVHLSHGLAWALAQLILNNLDKMIETQEATFVVPKDVVERLGLQAEYAELQARVQKATP